MWHWKRKIIFNFMSSWPLGSTLKDAIWSCFAPLTSCKLTQKMLQPANLKNFRKFHLIFLLLFLNETSKWLKQNIVIYTFVFQKVYIPQNIFQKLCVFIFTTNFFLKKLFNFTFTNLLPFNNRPRYYMTQPYTCQNK